ncbi:MAG: DUF6776 family protein [Luteimonas sp.]
MTEPASGPPPEPVPSPSLTAAAEPAHGHGLAYTVIVVFLFAMAFGGWGLWRVFAPTTSDPKPQLQAQQRQLDDLRQRVATLARSDQISRDANRDLQGTLAERDEEIAGLRADVAFYARFVGSTAQRRGLNVHALQMVRQTGQAWHFTATLTQNLNRGAVNTGRLTLSVEGSRKGRMQKLDWPQLRQQPTPPGLDYSFKYFQQVEGDILLPGDIQPVRVVVRLQPQGGSVVEQSFTWTEATAKPDAGG